MITPEMVYQNEGQNVKPWDPGQPKRDEKGAKAPPAIETFKAAMAHGAKAFTTEATLMLVKAAMEAEVVAVCGEKGKHDPNRKATRYGAADGSIALDGRHVPIRRPRIRTADRKGELGLETYREATEGNLRSLGEAVLAACSEGVSESHFERVLAALHGDGKKRGAFGASQQSASRHFVRATAEVVHELQTRRIEGRYLTLFMDGVEIGQRRVICVVGVDEDGHKRVLGLRAGATENAGVCRALLEELVARGLTIGERAIAVIDGGKALRSALVQVFGGRIVIARCRAHKMRNATEKVPDKMRKWLHDSLWRAWLEPKETARQKVTTIAEKLDRMGYTGAAASVREGIDDVLTVATLGLGSEMTRLLGTSNVIESVFSQCGRLWRRVTYWHNGKQVVRWLALGLKQAEAAFTDFATREQMQELDEALKRWLNGNPSPAKVAIAA